MKPALPQVAIQVFAEMMERAPTKDEQLLLRRLHDAYAGTDTPAAWWDTVHKFRLARIINSGFDWLQDQMSADLKAMRAKDATLASRDDVKKVVEDAAFYTLTLAAMCFVVGMLLGVLLHAVFVR